jgi:TolA-binding protein
MKPTHTTQVGHSTFAKLILLCIVASALLASLHPISCSDYWWELSKGREAAAGSLFPTSKLLAGSIRAEADWASGLLFYLLVDNGGVLSLMCLKIFAALFAARLLIQQTVQRSTVAGVLIATSLLCARQAWEPSPLCFDTIGVLLALTLTKAVFRATSLSAFVGLLILMCCWSNLGSRSITGILITVPTLALSIRRPVAKILCIAMLLVAASLTPAGLATLPDSWTTTFPQTAESSAILSLAGWSPWWSSPLRIECVAWLLLCCLSCRQAVPGQAGNFFLVLTGTQIFAAMSPNNLPLAAMMMAYFGTQLCGTTSDRVSDKVKVSNKDEARIDLRTRVERLVLTVLMGALATWALQPWSGCGSGLGWGIDPRLSPDAFSASLQSVSLTGTAHCVGIREAGLLSWHLRNGVKAFDTPRTALLNGRLRTHVLLTSDLSKNWQIPHRRTDESWGGWWLPLLERKTTTLVVPSEDLKLITAIEPTIWKPLSLNSVSLVYGKAGDPGCTQQIVNTLSLRDFVDRGTWVYQTTSEESQTHTDLRDVIYGANTVYESLRLARVFRAMKMSVAALKVLSMLPVESNTELRQEFASNQLSLGYDERILCGRSSRFRLDAWQLTTPQSDSVSMIAQDVLNWSDTDLSQNEAPDITATRLYLSGDHRVAMQKLGAIDAETLYAKAMMLLESGQTKETEAVLQQLVNEFPGHRLTASAKSILASLGY